MKNQFYLKNFKSKWIKYDNYDLREDSNGSIYIVPSEDSKYTIYDPFEKSSNILFDLIDLGDLVLKNESQDTLYNKLIVFVKHYGLLGLITSSVYNRDIVGEDNVIFSQNNIISSTLNLDTNIMKSEDYIKLFTPFAGEDDLYTREFDKHLTVVKAEDSPKFYGKKPLVLDIVFSKFYAEPLHDFARQIVVGIVALRRVARHQIERDSALGQHILHGLRSAARPQHQRMFGLFPAQQFVERGAQSDHIRIMARQRAVGRTAHAVHGPDHPGVVGKGVEQRHHLAFVRYRDVESAQVGRTGQQPLQRADANFTITCFIFFHLRIVSL